MSTLSTEETIAGLKSELERCLAMYRSKRTLVDKLQAELQTTQSKLDTAERTASQCQVRYRPGLHTKCHK